jgi:hypothetical protein
MMEKPMKWYVKLALCFGAVIVIFVVFVLYDQMTSGKIVFKTTVPGTMRETKVITFTLEKPNTPHVLIIHPSIESGWGDPDVHLTALLTGPDARILTVVGSDLVFGGIKPSAFYERSYADYEEKIPFTPTHAGVHTLTMTILTEHVKDVYIAVGEKADN